MSYEATLREKGYTLDSIDVNAGRFDFAVRTGNLVYTAGSVSRWEGKEIKGKVGRDVSVEEGYEAAAIGRVATGSGTIRLV